MSTGTRSLVILMSVVALDLVGFGIVVPILPFYAEQYGANGTVLGFLLMSYSAMQFLCAPLWGRLSDRIGRKAVLVLTMGGSCVALILLGLADSLVLIFLGRILSGFFAANIGVASAYVTDLTSEEDRSKGMGMIGAAFGVGFILGPALGGLLSTFGYHIPILAAALLTSLNMVYASLRLREPPRHRPVGESIQTAVLSERPVRILCVTYFIFTLAVTQLEAIFAFYMMDRFAFDARHVAVILAAMATVMVAVQGGLIHTLTRRFGEKPLAVSGSLILGLSFLLVPYSPTVALLMGPLLLAAIGRGISQPSLMSLVSKRGDALRRGAVMGTFQASASLGRVFGPIAAGLLYDQWIASPFLFAAVLMGVVFILSMTL